MRGEIPPPDAASVSLSPPLRIDSPTPPPHNFPPPPLRMLSLCFSPTLVLYVCQLPTVFLTTEILGRHLCSSMTFSSYTCLAVETCAV
jgi:hypothetical protein